MKFAQRMGGICFQLGHSIAKAGLMVTSLLGQRIWSFKLWPSPIAANL